MTEALRTYLLSVAAAALLMSLVQALLPKGSVRQIASFCGSLLVLLTVLSPLSGLDYETVARAIAELSLQTEAAETGITVQNRELMVQIIKEQCETYILDKAKEQGLQLEVKITIQEGTAYPYPSHAAIRGTMTAMQKQELSRWITDNLAIPPENQTWSSG